MLIYINTLYVMYTYIYTCTEQCYVWCPIFIQIKTNIGLFYISLFDNEISSLIHTRAHIFYSFLLKSSKIIIAIISWNLIHLLRDSFIRIFNCLYTYIVNNYINWICLKLYVFSQFLFYVFLFVFLQLQLDEIYYNLTH